MTICECGLLVVPAIYDSKGAPELQGSCKQPFLESGYNLGTLPLIGES